MKAKQNPAHQATGTRRKFLLGATLGSAGAVAAAVAGGSVKEALDVVAVVPEKQVKGYHETDHIRKYYQTTRI